MYRTDRQFMKNPATASSRIYIGGIADGVVALDIETIFKEHGNILGLSLQKGFGFIQYDTEAQAQAAIRAEHGKMFRGRKLNVKPAMDKGRSGNQNTGPQGQASEKMITTPSFEKPSALPSLLEQTILPPKQFQLTENLDEKMETDVIHLEDTSHDLQDLENDPFAGSDNDEEDKKNQNRRGGRQNQPRGRQRDNFNARDAPNRDGSFRARGGRGRGRGRGDFGEGRGRGDFGEGRGRGDFGEGRGHGDFGDVHSDHGENRGRGNFDDMHRRADAGEDFGEVHGRGDFVEGRGRGDIEEVRGRGDFPEGRGRGDFEGPLRDRADMHHRERGDALLRDRGDGLQFFGREEQFRDRPAPVFIPPPVIDRPERNDCEIIVVAKALTEYAEFIEQKLKAMGLVVDLLFPNEDVPIGRVLANISSRGCLYAILVMPQNEEFHSVTLNILHGIPQEHRNMPIEDALLLMGRNFDSYMRGEKQSAAPPNSVVALLGERHPEQIQILCNLLAENRQITTAQYDRLIKYLQERRDLQSQYEIAESGAELNADGEPNIKQAELQNRIMNILNKSTEEAPKPVEAPAPAQTAAPTPLLNDPSVQKALDSLLSGDMFKSIATGGF